jgi:dynein heavy chain 2, cytosolic
MKRTPLSIKCTDHIRKLLSRQQHYDWGLRALKSVLRTAGDGLRKSLSTSNRSHASDDKSQHEAESLVVVRALNFNTLSKLTRIDSTLFLGLVNDMFPNCISNMDSTHSNLIQIITNCYQEMGLTYLERQVIDDVIEIVIKFKSFLF